VRIIMGGSRRAVSVGVGMRSIVLFDGPIAMV